CPRRGRGGRARLAARRLAHAPPRHARGWCGLRGRHAPHRDAPRPAPGAGPEPRPSRSAWPERLRRAAPGGPVMEILEAGAQGDAAWDDLCAASPSAWFWHTTAWRDYTIAYRPELKSESRAFYVSDGEERVAL